MCLLSGWPLFSRYLSLTHDSGSRIVLSVHRQYCVMVMLTASGARLGSSSVEHWQCEARLIPSLPAVVSRTGKWAYRFYLPYRVAVRD